MKVKSWKGPDQERGSRFLKQLNEKYMTGVTEKEHEDGVPFKGEGIVTPMFPPACN
jgi:hypothetical protein